MAIPPLVVLEEIGLFPGRPPWVALAVDQLKYGAATSWSAPGSSAEELARRIGRTIPLVHGAQALGAAAALRWKAQVNENAKAPAFAAVYPELCHNEIAGWGQHGDVTRQVITLVNLRHDAEHPQVVRRFELVADVLREVVADIIEVRAQGEGDLAQLLDLVLVGDFVSLHLAAQEGIDPGPVPVLDEIKVRLREALTTGHGFAEPAGPVRGAGHAYVHSCTRRRRSRPRRPRAPAHRLGRRQHARVDVDPGALRQGTSPRGRRRRRLPARHHRDGQSPADPEGGGGRGARSARRTRCRPRTTWPPRWCATRASRPSRCKGEDTETYYAHIDAVLDLHPTMTMDDGCDLVSRIHQTPP